MTKMSIENKAEREATTEEESKVTDEESTEVDTKEVETEDEDKSSHSDNQDYETLLAKEREARERAEKALAEKRFKSSKERREADEDDDEEEKPLTEKMLQEILAKDRLENQKFLQAERIKDIAGKLSTSDAEKNLIIEIHKNRQFPEHLSLDEQLEECFAIANRQKLIGERNEALRALKNKSGVDNNSAGTHHDQPKAGEPKLSAVELNSLKGMGYVWNATSKLYEKKLKNGNTLVRDNAGQIRLIKA